MRVAARNSKCFGISPCGVRGQPGGLANSSNPAGEPTGLDGVPVGGVGVLVEQSTGHDEMASHLGREIGGQRAQLPAHVAVEFATGDFVQDRGGCRERVVGQT